MSPVNKFPFMPRALSQLIESFRLLPGIGPKTAQKLAFSTLKMSSEQVKDISNSLANIKSEIIYCQYLSLIHISEPTRPY